MMHFELKFLPQCLAVCWRSLCALAEILMCVKLTYLLSYVRYRIFTICMFISCISSAHVPIWCFSSIGLLASASCDCSVWSTSSHSQLHSVSILSLCWCCWCNTLPWACLPCSFLPLFCPARHLLTVGQYHVCSALSSYTQKNSFILIRLRPQFCVPVYICPKNSEFFRLFTSVVSQKRSHFVSFPFWL